MAEKTEKKEALAIPALGNFSLRERRDAYAVIQITKSKSVTLFFNGQNSQDDLKAVYDAGSQYGKWIKAPKGYKAPWQP